MKKSKNMKKNKNMKKDTKMKQNQKIILWGCAILLVFFVLALCRNGKTADAPVSENEQTEVETAAVTTEEPVQSGGLQVHFLDIGQGDCTLILCDGEAMLIDAGDNDQGTKIQLYLEKQGVSELKYVIGTHPDADHIGGLDVILYKFDCQTIMMPEIGSDTATYRDVVDTMEIRGYQNTVPAVGDRYSLGGAEFTILSPGRSYDDTNNNSIAIILHYGSHSFLFSGDAEEEAEADMMASGISLDADVYQVGHHGSRSSSTEDFLAAVSPQYAVISCKEGNAYGHPHEETLNRLRSMGIQVFRTDEQGTIVVVSDGENLVWNCSPSETWKAGEASEPDLETELAATPAETPIPTGAQADDSQVQAVPEQEQSEGVTEAMPEAEQSEAITEAAPEAVQSEGVAEAAPEPEVPADVITVLPEAAAGNITYVCNMNTGKFHLPSCSSVDQMAAHNRLDVTWTREECIEHGYVPCKRCNP